MNKKIKRKEIIKKQIDKNFRCIEIEKGEIFQREGGQREKTIEKQR